MLTIDPKYNCTTTKLEYFVVFNLNMEEFLIRIVTETLITMHEITKKFKNIDFLDHAIKTENFNF